MLLRSGSNGSMRFARFKATASPFRALRSALQGRFRSEAEKELREAPLNSAAGASQQREAPLNSAAGALS